MDKNGWKGNKSLQDETTEEYVAERNTTSNERGRGRNHLRGNRKKCHIRKLQKGMGGSIE